MKTMTTKQALAELKSLSKAAADNLYRRLELSAKVMADLDWIAQVHGGSDLKAQDALQSEFFADLGGYVTLGTLLAMFRNVPKSEWATCRYNVAAVEVIYRDQANGVTKQGTRTAWKKIAEDRLEQLEAAEARIQELESIVSEQAAKIARQGGQIEQLERLMPNPTGWANRTV